MKNFSFHHLLRFVIHGQLSKTETNSQNIYVAGRPPDALWSPTIRSSFCVLPARAVCLIHHSPLAPALPEMLPVAYTTRPSSSRSPEPLNTTLLELGALDIQRGVSSCSLELVTGRAGAHSHPPYLHYKHLVLLCRNLHQHLGQRLLL